MSSEVKRYSVVLHVANDSPFRQTGDSCTRPIRTDVVLATDYAALEAECEKLQLKVMVWNDGKPYAALKAERDALEAENARLVERTGYLVEFAQQMARQQGEPYYRLLAKAALKKWSEP